jgi:hypothetical protein
VAVKLKSGSLDYRQKVRLLDGSMAVIRTICPADSDEFLAFFSRLSEKTIFLRYQYAKNMLSQTELNDFCTFVYPEKLVLIAEIGVGKKRIVGVGNYYRLRDPVLAEAAFVVEDGEQNKGIGTHLLRHLSLLALQNDIRYFIADVPRINARMLSIFKKADPMLTLENDGSSCNITVALYPDQPHPIATF